MEGGREKERQRERDRKRERAHNKCYGKGKSSEAGHKVLLMHSYCHTCMYMYMYMVQNTPSVGL